ncbi:pTP [Bovine adenovirus 7]|nr:pTP [Bovine adenovirus 7]URN46027.1 pTP [Bovine adenovirus 7]
MTARQIQQWQQLTGQSQHTLRYMRLTVDLNQPSIFRTSISTERGIKWASRYFDYPVCQLLDLRPRGPVTSNFPFDGEPPPNLLLGYFYLAKILNQYLFDQRTYSRITYKLHFSPIAFQRRMIWQILTDCSYSINTGSYSRALQGLRNFNETISQIQNAVLMDRIYGSLQTPEMQGFGAAIHAQERNRIFQAREPYEAFSMLYRMHNLEERDILLINCLCKIRKALCNFLVLSKNGNCNCILDLPFSYDWLSEFIETFCQFSPSSTENQSNFRELATVLTLGKPGMRGGALTLRSGTRVGLPFRLRPRENYRAVTESLRRNRGHIIRRFIDNLPIRRRRRETSEEPQITPEISETEEDYASDREPSSSDLSRTEFNDEVIAVIVDLIQNLEDELTLEARRSVFFNYGTEFFQLLIRYYNENRLTEDFVERWLIYFFILEHIASTLYYLHSQFIRVRVASRNIGIQFAQIILRGRNNEGQEVFTRVWSNRDREAFRQLYERILRDFLGIVEAAEHESLFASPEEREQLLQDIQYVENSGDVEEIIEQINANLQELESVEIAFRIKFSGIVAYSTNNNVLRSFERLRQSALDRWLQRP